MRKFLIFVMVSLLTVGLSMPVNSEGLDLSTFDLNQLVELRTRIDLEIAVKLGDGESLINAGWYIAGKDIKPGKYELFPLEDGKVHVGKFKSLEVMDTIVDRESILKHEVHEWIKLGTVIYVGLEEGNLLIIQEGAMVIREVKPSWSP